MLFAKSIVTTSQAVVPLANVSGRERRSSTTSSICEGICLETTVAGKSRKRVMARSQPARLRGLGVRGAEPLLLPVGPGALVDVEVAAVEVAAVVAAGVSASLPT